MDQEVTRFWTRAEESLAGAQAELTVDRYNNAAERSYYAVFQAGVACCLGHGDHPDLPNNSWSHQGTLRRLMRHLLRWGAPTDLVSKALSLHGKRLLADYYSSGVTRRDAEDSVSVAKKVLEYVQDWIVKARAAGGTAP